MSEAELKALDIELVDTEEEIEEEECEHEFDADEGFTCLNCGKDGMEEVLSSAYDRAKELRQYGE